MPFNALSKGIESATGINQPSRSVRDWDPDNDKLVAIADRLEREAEDATWEDRRKRSLNLAMWRGYHQARWDPSARNVILNPVVPRQFQDLRIYLNLWKAISQTFVSRFEGARPRIIAVPRTSDQASIDKSKVLEQIVTRYEWPRLHFDQILAEAIVHLNILGTAIIKLEWDPHAGRVEGVAEVTDQETGDQRITLVHEQGNRASVVHPNDLLVDPTVVNFDDANYVIHVSEVHAAHAYNHFGVLEQPETPKDTRDRYTSRRMSEIIPKTVRLRQVWIKPGVYPTSDNPDDDLVCPMGYVYTVVGKRVAKKGPNPNAHGLFPFAYMRYLRDPERLPGETIMSDLRVCQVALNKAMHLAMDSAFKMAAPFILTAKQAPIHEKDRSSIPRHVEWDAAGGAHLMPQQFPGMGAAPQLSEVIRTIIDLMQLIAGWREGGMAGGAPPSILSGVHAQTVVASDVSRLESTAREIGAGIERVFTLAMHNNRQYMSEQRAITVAGDMLASETLEFMGSDIPEDFLLQVVPDSVLPATRESKTQKAMALYNMGGFGPPGTPMAVRELMKRVGEDDSEELTLDKIQIDAARNENREALETGKVMTPPEQMSLEDHALHVNEHLRDLFSLRFRRNNQAYAGLYEHVRAHINMENAQAMAAMEAASPADELAPEVPAGNGVGEPAPAEMMTPEAEPAPAM